MYGMYIHLPTLSDPIGALPEPQDHESNFSNHVTIMQNIPSVVSLAQVPVA